MKKKGWQKSKSWFVYFTKRECCTRTRNYSQIWQAEKLSTWLLSSGQDFSKKFLDSKHVLEVYLKPSRKNPKISFLPLCSKLVRLKILYLRINSKPDRNQSKLTMYNALTFLIQIILVIDGVNERLDLFLKASKALLNQYIRLYMMDHHYSIFNRIKKSL